MGLGWLRGAHSGGAEEGVAGGKRKSVGEERMRKVEKARG